MHRTERNIEKKHWLGKYFPVKGKSKSTPQQAHQENDLPIPDFTRLLLLKFFIYKYCDTLFSNSLKKLFYFNR